MLNHHFTALFLSLILCGCASANAVTTASPTIDQELPSSPESQIVDEQLAAYNAHDADKMVTYFAEDAELLSFDGKGPSIQGRAAIHALFKQLFTNSPRVMAVVTQRIVTGEYVVDRETATEFSDKYRSMVAVAIYRVANGKIQSLTLLPPQLDLAATE